MTTSTSNYQIIVNAAETVARIYGDTETARRLEQLAAEVQDVEGDADNSGPHLICSVCGGSVAVTPRVECPGCGFVYLP